MSSVILSGTPAALAVVAADLPNPLVAAGVGGGQFIAQSDGTAAGSVTCNAGAGNGSGTDVYVINGGVGPGTGSARWAIGTDFVEAGANSGNDLTIYRYGDGGVFLGSPLRIVRATGLVGLQTGFDASQCGNATVLTGQTTIVVALPTVTAATVIICSPSSAPDVGGAQYVSGVTINPTVGFTITVSAAVVAVAGWNLSWFVARF